MEYLSKILAQYWLNFENWDFYKVVFYASKTTLYICFSSLNLYLGRNNMLHEIAKRIFDLFIVNRNALAIQQKNGMYLTKYTKVSENSIYYMLKNRKSIGTYQQLTNSPFLKWICFDFDCSDKENPDLNALYNNCTKPLNDFLRVKNISFINEFSGRRGIHTWIIFDNLLTKGEAFNILSIIKSSIKFNYDKSLFNLDEFPATSVSRGNKIGKQVKIPLSVHSCGKQSFLFADKYYEIKYDDDFWENQLSVLKKIKTNKITDVYEALNIKNQKYNTFKKVYITDSLECTSEQVIDILSQTLVFNQLFDRLMHGEMLTKDWYVLLGTLGKVKNGTEVLLDILKYCPNFSEEETRKHITQYGRKYFPATFRYLYDIYDMEIEEKIDPNMNGLQYLIKNLDPSINIHEWKENEITLLNDSKYTIKKEINYLFTNDEVPVVSVYLDLVHMTSYDSETINKIVLDISEGKEIEINPGKYYLFNRIESETKQRKLISLSSFDRVLTTQMALVLFYKINREIKSFSYNPNYISENDIFFHWYNSWGNYLSQIHKYLDIDLYENMHVIMLDVSHFYDSIDFLGIYKLFEKYLDEKETKLLQALIQYNDKLMRKINGTRKGVPQGPAYARLIAETFMGILINKIVSLLVGNNKEYLQIYRYVDDIIIFHTEDILSNHIYDTFKRFFSEYGLCINNEKSKIYGCIKGLSENQRSEILREGQFQYGLKKSDYSYLLEDRYIKEKVREIEVQKGKFNISNASFFFSPYIDDRARRQFFNKYSKEIFACSMGRGSGYSIFYKYVLSNGDVISECIDNSMFEKIPINSINFSCFLTSLYYAYMKNYLPVREYEPIIKTYIFELKSRIKEIESEEDKSLVNTLASQIKDG